MQGASANEGARYSLKSVGAGDYTEVTGVMDRTQIYVGGVVFGYWRLYQIISNSRCQRELRAGGGGRGQGPINPKGRNSNENIGRKTTQNFRNMGKFTYVGRFRWGSKRGMEHWTGGGGGPTLSRIRAKRKKLREVGVRGFSGHSK